MIDYRVLVQARMSSSRFPGKMLAPLRGRPLIDHVLARVSEAVPRERVILVTSDHSSDDPLAMYVETALGVKVFRGSLDDVVARFKACLRAHPCEWFVRICGDSPGIDPGLLAWMLNQVADDVDLLTNAAERTFPPGQSVEIVRSRTLLGLTTDEVTSEEGHHGTLHFYRHPERYRIRNVLSADPALAARRMVVDTLDDLRAFERILETDPGWLLGYDAGARMAQAV